MFNKKTVLVIGAGASQEVKLPTGTELKKQIANLLDINFVGGGVRQTNGDLVIVDALRLHLRLQDGRPGNINPYLHAGRTIRDAMPQAISIDNFIDAHHEDKSIELCGKLAIVRGILQAEKRSLLNVETERYDDHPKYQKLADTWLIGFHQLLTENCKIKDLGGRLASIALVIFNYDRCIEHFLYHSLQTYYQISPQTAAELVNRIEIYHPYGSVGHLPWQKNEDSVGFGAEPDGSQLLALAAQIKTFTEGTDESSSEISTIRQRVLEAKILVFLGFHFHRLNLRLLTITSASSSRKPEGYDYYATALGISKSDCEMILADVIKMKGARPQSANLRNDLSCNLLLREYWRSLSLSE